ncbi:MAG TPA: hypothetical protein PKH02_04235 [Bacteroidales bacterium]|nr:hypothetical protein [Bacteroidales bacterium]HPT11526.1 hypothetical protein [Bacteroidales bacterium]
MILKLNISELKVRLSGETGMLFTTFTSSSTTGCGNGLGTTSSTGSTPR